MENDLILEFNYKKFNIFSFGIPKKYLITDNDKIEEYPLVKGKLIGYSNPEKLPKTLKKIFKTHIKKTK